MWGKDGVVGVVGFSFCTFGLVPHQPLKLCAGVGGFNSMHMSLLHGADLSVPEPEF